MKGIKEWLERINTDENFSKKFENLNDVKDVVELAEKEGYKLTEDELMDIKMEAVSGGAGLGSNAWGLIKKGYQWLDKTWKSEEVRSIRKGIHGIFTK